MRPPRAVGHIPRLAAGRAGAPPSPPPPPNRPPSFCPRNPRRAGPLANNITTFTAGVAASLPVRGVAAQLQSAAAVGHSSAIATVATVSAALESTWGRDRCVHAPAALHQGCCRAAGCRPAPACAARRELHPTACSRSTRAAAHPRRCPPTPPLLPPPPRRLPKECQSPTEWFIADDPQHHTRLFVIQVGAAAWARGGDSAGGGGGLGGELARRLGHPRPLPASRLTRPAPDPQTLASPQPPPTPPPAGQRQPGPLARQPDLRPGAL